MIYKSLSFLVLLVFLMGANQIKAQEDVCACIDEVSAAVDAVMANSGCDTDGLWEAPHALEVHLKKLQNWCGPQDKPLKSKVPNIVEGMLETIQEAIDGEYIEDPLTGEVIWIQVPAPDCALDALSNLESLLMYGCAAE